MTNREREIPSSASACVTLGAMAALGTGSLKDLKKAGWCAALVAEVLLGSSVRMIQF